MRKLAWIFACWVGAVAAQAHEADIDTHIRDYILDHPEIILQAMEILADREQAAAMTQKIAAFPFLFENSAGLGIGASDAPVKVVEFFDYKCAPCKALHPQLKALVSDTPDLRIEMRHLPILSPGSERAARFALAVQQRHGHDMYAIVHQILWELHGPLSYGQIQDVAEQVGLDFAALEPVMDSAAITERIDANRTAALELGILGTPGFVSKTDVSFGGGDLTDLAARWLSQ